MPSLLEDILLLEELDSNLFRSRKHCENFRNTLFGGQVLGQGLMAAYNTQDGALPNSLHAYFLRPGSSDIPVIYDVEKVRDGRTFSSRRAVARQYGRPIFNMSASFHKPEEGFEHQLPAPADIPHPEAIIAEREGKRAPKVTLKHENSVAPFLFVSVEESIFSNASIDPPVAYFWMKSIETLPDDPILHHCALAYASDLGLLATALLPHKSTLFDNKMLTASLDHAMWFHNPHFRADEWLLCKTFSPWAGSARGFSQGQIFDLQGKLIASTAQEGLIRSV